MHLPLHPLRDRKRQLVFGEPVNELAQGNLARTDIFIPYNSATHSHEELSDLIHQRQHVCTNFGPNKSDYMYRQSRSIKNQHDNNNIKLVSTCEPIDDNFVADINDEDRACSLENIEPEPDLKVKKMRVSDAVSATPPEIVDSSPSSHHDITSHNIPPPKPDAKKDYAKPQLAPSITNDMSTIYNVVLFDKDKDEIIIDDKPFAVKQFELACFVPGSGQWLHDPVVDYYLELIVRRSRTNAEKYLSVYTFRSTFFTLLETEDGLEKVKETTDNENIFKYDLIFFPVCQHKHWRLIVVDVNSSRVRSYNSWGLYFPWSNRLRGSPDKQIINIISRYLEYEFKRCFPTRNVPQLDIDLDLDNVPKQNNFDDCGVFALQFGNYLSGRKSFDFDATHMEYFRYRMLYECLSGRLLPLEEN